MITRALKIEIVFPGWRRADLGGTETVEIKGKPTRRRRKGSDDKPVPALWPDLREAMRDIGAAQTKAAQIMWALKLGVIPIPREENGKPKSERTLAYQLFSGAWQPVGTTPCYEARGPRLAGGVLSVCADQVLTRLKTEWRKTRCGERALPAFRPQSIPFRADGCRVLPNLDVTLQLWAKGGRGPLLVRARKLGASERAILRRIVAGELKQCGGHLTWDERRGKWMLALVWGGEVEQATGPLICGVHLGMTTTCSLAYVDAATGKVQPQRDLVQIPTTVLRAMDRHRADREQRRRTVRADGRGHQRAWRHEEGNDRGERIARTACDQVASRVVQEAIRRGASAIGVEDLDRWSVDRALKELPDAVARVRARRMIWYFRWHQGTLRAAIACAAEREGLPVLDVDATYDSRTCSSCGRKFPVVETIDGVQYGRIEWRWFRCPCMGGQPRDDASPEAQVAVSQQSVPRGQHRKVQPGLHADRNAAINVAKRAHEMSTSKRVDTGEDEG